MVRNHHTGALASTLRDVQPTEQDKTLTRALVLAATTVQIKILDHLIVSPDHAFSFRQDGLL
jgi:DNA repair protein RadC